MAFAIATNVPKPVASISFNAVNIKTVALLPVASIGINITPVFRIKAEAQLPVGAILFNDTFKIKASALLPDASLSFNSSTVFSIAAKSKFRLLLFFSDRHWLSMPKQLCRLPV